MLMYDKLTWLNTGDYDIVELLELMLLLFVVMLINFCVWYMMLCYGVDYNISDVVVIGE